MRTISFQKEFILQFILFIFLFSFFSFFHSDLGVTYDSLNYIQSAESLISKGEYMRIKQDNWVPNTHFPPLVSSILAFLSIITKLSVIQSFILLNSICFASSFLLIFKILHPYFQKYAIIFTASLFITPLFQIYEMAWSEPLFISVFLFAIFKYYNWLENNSSIYFWIISLSFLPLIRYAGIYVFLTIPILIAIKDGKIKIYHFILSGLATIPFLLWIIRNYLVSASSTNRVLKFVPESINTIWEGTLTIRNWIIPLPIFSIDLHRIFLALFVISISFLIYRPKDKFNKALITLMLGYLMFLCVSVFFFDPATPFDFRILILFLLPLSLFYFIDFSASNNKYYLIFFSVFVISHLLNFIFKFEPHLNHNSIQVLWEKNNQLREKLASYSNENLISDEYECELLSYISQKKVQFWNSTTIPDSGFVISTELNLNKIPNTIVLDSLILKDKIVKYRKINLK